MEKKPLSRREISTALLAATAGSTVVTQRAEAQTCTAPCFAQTAVEIDAGVTPVNYAYVPGDVRRYGAVGDGVTNDTDALALTINLCLYSKLTSNLTSRVELDVIVNGTCLIASSIAINYPISTDRTYLRIRSSNGGGFVVNSNISMFTTSTSHYQGNPNFPVCPAFVGGATPSGSVSHLIYFDGISFSSNGPGVGTVLQDNQFARMRFHGCNFYQIGLQAGTTQGYTQSLQITNCNIRHGSGPFFSAGSSGGFFSIDFKFNNNICEAWTGDFLHVGMAQGGWIVGNCMEGISGTAILLDGCQGCTIAGNYWESNGLDVDMTGPGGTEYYAVSGFILTGNSDQTSSNRYVVKWPAASGNILGATVGGNFFLGWGHMTPANAAIGNAAADFAQNKGGGTPTPPGTALWSNVPV